MALFWDNDYTYAEFIQDQKAKELKKAAERLEEATDILRALVQLKLMKSVHPEVYEDTKEDVWRYAEKFLTKNDFFEKERFAAYRAYVNATPEVREEYRRHYERLSRQDD